MFISFIIDWFSHCVWLSLYVQLVFPIFSISLCVCLVPLLNVFGFCLNLFGFSFECISSSYVNFQFLPPLCTHLIPQVVCFGSSLAYCKSFLCIFGFPLCVLNPLWCVHGSSLCTFGFLGCVCWVLLGVFFNPFCAHSISSYVFWVLFGVFLNPFCAHSISSFVFWVLLSFFLHPFCAHLVPPCEF